MELEQVAVIVDDYDDAISFFVDLVGFELVEDSTALANDGRPKRWVVVRPPGGTCGLVLASAEGRCPLPLGRVRMGQPARIVMQGNLGP